jgi:hypothetical protein
MLNQRLVEITSSFFLKGLKKYLIQHSANLRDLTRIAHMNVENIEALFGKYRTKDIEILYLPDDVFTRYV